VTTSISSAGTYGPGNYHLAADISGGMIFAGDATLDLNGRIIGDVADRDTVTFGVHSTHKLTVLDGIGGGKITGFWAGVKAEGDQSYLLGIDLSGNRYIGALLQGNYCSINGVCCNDIGGVTNEPYATGIQCDGFQPIITNCQFRNLYRQHGYQGAAPGEGLAVNLSAQSASGRVQNINFVNDVFEDNTVGVFAGSGGGHVIEWVQTHNVRTPVVTAENGLPSVVRHISASYTQ